MVSFSIDHDRIFETEALTHMLSNASDINVNINHAKDFDFQNLTRQELKNKKMPFINCNRKVFCNSDFDLVDLFILDGKNLVEEFKSSIKDIILDLESIIKIMKKLFDFSKETNTIEYLQSRAMLLEGNVDMEISWGSIYKLIQLIDKYVFEDINENFFAFQVKQSVIIKDVFENNQDNFIGLGRAIINIMYVYNCTLLYFQEHTENFSRFEEFSPSINILAPNILIENIVLKWEAEYTKNKFLAVLTKSNLHKHEMTSLIYCIHTTDTLIIEMTGLIKKIIIGIIEKEISNEIKITKPNNISNTSEVSEYEIMILNKLFIVKKYNTNSLDSISSRIFPHLYILIIILFVLDILVFRRKATLAIFYWWRRKCGNILLQTILIFLGIIKIKYFHSFMISYMCLIR